jgi:CubicO group peptidase (beta-lactamase class C family)
MAAHGLHLRPRDLAKIAQLVLDGGRWRGQQVVPSDWLASSTMAQTDSAHQDRGGHLFPYGFYWWIVPDVGFTVWGHGGQFALVVPARRLLLVQIALPDADLHGSDLNDFLELVAPLL